MADHVRIAGRFRRAVRIDTDLGSPAALEGFICPRSSADVLETMARHIAETGQGAFTWTGPYGGGKSSLAVALGALLNGRAELRRRAESIVGGHTANAVWKALPPRTRGWRILPVVGRRDSAPQAIAEAVAASGWRTGATTPKISGGGGGGVEYLQQAARQYPRAGGGLLVLIDEMGKFLEAAVHDGADIYFFQQLAEIASRSNGRLIVVGILHQAFEEYAHRLSREARNEWSKIQGRFVDLAVHASGHEQIDLVSRAIGSDRAATGAGPLAARVASLLHPPAPADLPQRLEDCWPLHPVVACLLGPLSQRRFGQNQRSIFGFLNSSEPRGFQDFLRHAAHRDLYTADLLWDYLRVNLEPSIMASPDGHRWALAVATLDRCEAGGGDELQLRLLKTIALVDLLKDRSGLAASRELLECALFGLGARDNDGDAGDGRDEHDHSGGGPDGHDRDARDNAGDNAADDAGALDRALEKMQKRSLIVFRKHAGSYSIFEGSDFDIDRAVERTLAATGEVDYGRLNALAATQPVIAKRHYHETGALRWFDVAVAPLTGLAEAAAAYRFGHGALGVFFLALPEAATDEETARAAAQDATREACRRGTVADGDRDMTVGPDDAGSRDNAGSAYNSGNPDMAGKHSVAESREDAGSRDEAGDHDVVVGLPKKAGDILWLAKELLALEQVRDETPDLQGDRVARNEVDTRIADVQGRIESELSRAFDGAVWHRRNRAPDLLAHSELNRLASDLADERFPCAPRLHNELLNRVKPSSNAVAAQKALLRRMIRNEGAPRLGIDGFPPEGGLFESLLKAPGLYRETPNGPRFQAPASERDTHRLAPAWQAATDFLKRNDNRTVSAAEIYDVWRRAPFGIKDGLLPVLWVAFVLSRREDLAFYRQGIFQAGLSDLDVDYLVNDPAAIQVRWMDLPDWLRGLLSEMAGIVRELDSDNKLADLAPIDVARGLVAVYDQAPPWTGRTQRLSANAKRVRQLFRHANDPNKLLFDDIPQMLGGDGEGGGEGGAEDCAASHAESDTASHAERGAESRAESDGLGNAEGGTASGKQPPLNLIASRLRDGLTELRQAWPNTLHRLRETLLAELQVPHISPPMLAELRARAGNIRQLAGDHRLEAFVLRLARFQGTDEDMESLASMATHKPPRDWVDADIDRASVQLAEFAQQFNRAEAFARVKGRPDKRHAMAVVVGMGNRPTPLHYEFDITDMERGQMNDLVRRMGETLASSGEKRRNVILAALAELSARFLRDEPPGAGPPARPSSPERSAP